MNKRNFDAKKVLAAIVATGVLASGTAVFADFNPDRENPVLEGGIVTTGAELSKYNGRTIPRVEVKEIDGHKMFPLREVAEMLNFKVEWTEAEQVIQLFRGPQSIGMRIGADEYSYLRMAPLSLGAAPVLVDDTTTYVPVALITELIGARVFDNEDGSIQVVEAAQVTLNEVKENENGNISISVEDSVLGEVIVHIGENTEIKKGSEVVDAAALNDLEEGDALEIGYSAAMTMSIPPQTTAIFINIPGDGDAIELVPDEENEDNKGLEDVKFDGVIKSVEEDRVLVDDNGYDRILNITEDTAITSGDEKRLFTIEDLKEGAEVTVVRSAIETRSIPPISNAVSIDITK